jgi:hypothetical protein
VPKFQKAPPPKPKNRPDSPHYPFFPLSASIKAHQPPIANTPKPLPNTSQAPKPGTVAPKPAIQPIRFEIPSPIQFGQLNQGTTNSQQGAEEPAREVRFEIRIAAFGATIAVDSPTQKPMKRTGAEISTKGAGPRQTKEFGKSLGGVLLDTRCRFPLRQSGFLWLATIFALSSVFAQSSQQTAKKAAPPTIASRRSTGVSKTAVASAQHSRRNSAGHEQASSGTTRIKTRKVVVTRKLVHGHWVRTTQIVRAAPGPSYQTHPDPDRYTQIQQALAGDGYFKGQVNGQWGDDSVEALKQFQADHKLPNDGKISALSLIGLGLGPTHTAGNAGPAAKDSAAPPASPAPAISPSAPDPAPAPVPASTPPDHNPTDQRP